MADEGRAATPWWVWSGKGALAVLLLAALALTLSGQGHGPGRHLGHDVAPVEESAP